jgi:predicted O-methyltransferase YrrM
MSENSATRASKPLYTDDYVAFSAFDRIALATLVGRVARPGCRMAEVGSWLGNGSTQVFLEELHTCADSSLLCVDTWRGNLNVQRHQDIVSRYDVFGTFQANVERARSPVKLQALVSSSHEAAPLLADSTFDLVFIDADHSYVAVRDDVAAWRSKVRPGGILCGHDCEMRVTPALESHLRAHRDADTIPMDGTGFATIHPGSILAVHEAFQGQASLFAEMPLQLPNGVPGCSTIWFLAV